MTFEDAIALAREIHECPHAELLAIGRFQPADQITTATPWGVSLMMRGESQFLKCFSADEWRDLVASRRPKPKPKRAVATRPKPTNNAAETPAARPDVKFRSQPTLF